MQKNQLCIAIVAPCRMSVHFYGNLEEFAIHGVQKRNRIMNVDIITLHNCKASVGE